MNSQMNAACWNPAVVWNNENPWVVGIGDHDEYEDLSGCISVCAEHATCYRKGYDEEEGASEEVVACGRFFMRPGSHVCYLR